MKPTNLNSKKHSGQYHPLFNGIAGLILLSMLMVTSCHTTKNSVMPGQSVEVIGDEDSTTYELIVLDPGFESFLVSQPSANFYSQQYFENWNQQYVIEWNQRHRSPFRYGDFYETEIDYQPNVDYGLDLNYRLYYYFQFIKEKYGIVLINRGR